jgi:N-acetylglucosamine kinase-like BadF-type ATPase
VFAPGGREKVTAALTAIRADLPDLPIGRIHAGVTGLTEKAPAAAVVRAMLSEALGVAPAVIRVESDIELLARRTFAPGEGYLIYAGTGSVGAYHTPEGEVVTVGGKGILIDDAGGGAWIALTALRAVLRREEEEPGAGFATTLGRELAAEMGGSDWDTIRALVYGGDRGAVGLLAIAVARAAKQGDETAAAILAEADKELMRLAEVLTKRFGKKRVVVRGRAAGMV